MKAVYGESRMYGLGGGFKMENDIKIVRMQPPFEKYLVYSDGRVFAEQLPGGTNKPHWVKPYKINSGYLVLRLWANNKEYKWLIHRLVAALFIPNPNNYKVVNHIDGNRLNNNYWNLEWTTQKGNLLEAQKAGLSPDRSMHPYEIRCLATGEHYIFSNVRAALQYAHAQESRYAINVSLRRQLETSDNQFFPIKDTDWDICLRRDLLVSDYKWPI